MARPAWVLASVLNSLPCACALLVFAQTPAFAAGGRGGAPILWPSGGADSSGATSAGSGEHATTLTQGGGGGGAGVSAGNGGAGLHASGGTAPIFPSDPPNAGSDSATSGAGGGAGGIHGGYVASAPLSNLRGSNGGAGGTSTFANGGGGGGGAGGWGLLISPSFSGGMFTTIIQGGNGGAGGNGSAGFGGSGGSGGKGLYFEGANTTAIIAGPVSGGNGGQAGQGPLRNGSVGQGGIGIEGSGIALTLRNTVAGGMHGDGISRENSISFSGGTNALLLEPGWDLLGEIALAGTLDISSTLDTSLDQAITGLGALNKIGASTITLTASNSYLGGTTISAGTLQLGSGSTGGSLIGDIVNNANLAFNRSDNITFSGLISGTGAVSTIGPGVLTLIGDNSYTGETNIATASTLQVGNGGLDGQIGSGAIHSDGTLIFARGTTAPALTLSQSLTGSGNLRFRSGTTMRLLDHRPHLGSATQK